MKDHRKGGIVVIDNGLGASQTVFMQGRNSELFINGRKSSDRQIGLGAMAQLVKAIAKDIVAKAEAQRLATKAQCYAKASGGLGVWKG